MSDQWQRKSTRNIFTLRANNNSNPIVNTTTEQGITGEVIPGNVSPRAKESKG